MILYYVLWIRHRNNNLKTKTMNELKITIPEGYEIDKANSTFELIKFNKIEKQLPKTWEELEVVTGFCISPGFFRVIRVDISGSRITAINGKSFFPTKEYAEAVLALAQLLQLRQVYNDGWEPDWTKNIEKYVILTDSAY